jgi:hypothetical protein
MSFDASCLAGGEISLDWKTASERSTLGFEIERRVADEASPFVTVASYNDHPSLIAAGNSTVERSYHYLDPVAPDVYEYRLAEISLDGSRTTHQVVRVDASHVRIPAGFSITSHYTTGSSFVRVTTPNEIVIDCTVYDLLGRAVAILATDQLKSAGSHDLEVPHLTAGAYLVSVRAIDPANGTVQWEGTTAITSSSSH